MRKVGMTASEKLSWAVSLYKAAKRATWEFGRALSEVHSDWCSGRITKETYRGWARKNGRADPTRTGFDYFVQKEFGMSATAAMIHIRVTGTFTKLEFEQIGVTKLDRISKAPEHLKPRLREMALHGASVAEIETVIWGRPRRGKLAEPNDVAFRAFPITPARLIRLGMSLSERDRLFVASKLEESVFMLARQTITVRAKKIA